MRQLFAASYKAMLRCQQKALRTGLEALTLSNRSSIISTVFVLALVAGAEGLTLYFGCLVKSTLIQQLFDTDS